MLVATSITLTMVSQVSGRGAGFAAVAAATPNHTRLTELVRSLWWC